ncbi:glycosyl hydrolase [Candidatus Ruminimicrobium bovinum]|uniref:glycosyl hydrolase n=1 Tax=Candidatus Ruminimicrobium bovinum TaxID=3242779 RepID=UPI0039B8A139
MRKFFSALILFFCFSICFSAEVPTVTGKGSIRKDLPPGVTPPEIQFKTNNIKNPFPTNKWFNSILFSCYDSNFANINPYSFKMYTYPQVFKCTNVGMLIMYPKTSYTPDIINYGSGETSADNYANTLELAISTTTSNGYSIKFSSTVLDGYSDFSSTMMWQGEGEYSDKYIKATIGQGFVFSYFEFSDKTYPSINFPYSWDNPGNTWYEGNYWHIGDSGYEPGYTLYDTDGNSIPANLLSYGDENTDKLLLKVHLKNKDVYYGIFVPKGTIFSQDSSFIANPTGWYVPWIRIAIDLPKNKNYMSVALLPSTTIEEAIEDMKVYYKYAYNFVTKTKAVHDTKLNSNNIYSTTEFNITTTKKRTDVANQQNGTIFCLFPHQYNNIYNSPAQYGTKTFQNTLRGNLKIYTGSSFSTKTGFNGIVPFFNYNISQEAKNKITQSLKKDKTISPDDTYEKNTYYYGKNIARIANLITVADNMADEQTKNELIHKVKNELIDWFTYNSGEELKYFSYDKIWGGLIGIYDGFGTRNYNDHHFHYGYFIYAAAIIAMYDENFAKDYGSVVNLLIQDIANTERNNRSFPYMRCFDFYESHSWANGMGGADDRGIDIESSSEAMNAWAAIYMWGLATKNTEYINLGIYLYSNEYQAIKNYFFDTGEEKNILKNEYSHICLGILFAGSASYNELWWKQFVKYGARQYQGIQLLPMTASMLYVGYDSNYAQSFYNQDNFGWNDIWTRFYSIFNNNASSAWDIFSAHHTGTDEIDDGGTETYTYHFIDFFRQNGNVQSNYTSNFPAYLVTKKNDTTTYTAYNYTDTVQNIKFYNGSNYEGYVKVLPKSFISTTKLLNENTQTELLVFPVPYKPGSNTMYDSGDGITFLGLKEGSNIKIFNVSGELVYEKSIENNEKKFIWNAKNNSGNKIASGVYIYYITSADGTKHKGKLAIER